MEPTSCFGSSNATFCQICGMINDAPCRHLLPSIKSLVQGGVVPSQSDQSH